MGTCTETYTNIYCTRFQAELEVMIIAFQGIQVLLKTPVKTYRKYLTDLLTQPISDIQEMMEALDALNFQIQLLIPGSDCVNDLLEIAKKCSLIGDTLKIQGVPSLTFDLGDAVKKLIDDTIKLFSAVMLQFAEYPVAVYCFFIDDLLSKSGIKDMLAQFNKYVECGNAICHGMLSPQIDEINQLMNDMYLSENGTLDRARLYEEINIDARHRANMDACYDTIKADKDAGLEKLDTSVNSVVTTFDVLFG